MKKFLLSLIAMSFIFLVSYYKPSECTPDGYNLTYRAFDTLAEANKFVQKCKALGYLEPKVLDAKEL
jgi:hypothetical protein